ncbi:hypothetical protein P7C70_g3653, partial [Phenoliferia sp. Uapishka_3]
MDTLRQPELLPPIGAVDVAIPSESSELSPVEGQQPHRSSSAASSTSTRVDCLRHQTINEAPRESILDDAAAKSALTPPDAAGALPKELDIEHLLVKDDPRLWSNRRKSSVLAIIAITAMGGTISASVYFPALPDLQKDLNATNGLVSASVSLFILGQGVFPSLWSGISEIKGRKKCYLAALAIYVASTAGCSQSNSIGLFLGMRILQSLGSSAVLSLGAGTLADIYDVHERGTRLGVFYGVPLLGPSLGPLIGGALTSKFSWRSTFYFLLAYGVICFLLMIWLPETFRKERSLAWRLAMERAQKHARDDLIKARKELPTGDVIAERQSKTAFAAPTPSQLERNAPPPPAFPGITRMITGLSLRSGEDNVKIHFRDVNPNIKAAASQAATPITDAIGNGWYYTAFAFVLAIGQVGLVVVCWKGKQWRDATRARAEQDIEDEKLDLKDKVERPRKRLFGRK